jgi:peptide/nickel transport system substrate-binding protein
MKPERDERIAPSGTRLIMTRREVLAAAALGLAAGPVRPIWAAADGQLTWAIHVSLAPAWFEPAEASGIITPFMVFYALHDAMVKPMPEKPLAPSLAESWSAPEDGRTYEFVLRDGAKFHNGEPVTAEDVKFSFERYRGTAHDLLQQRVATVEALDARRVRFQLKEPWPDFLLFYATMTGAGWIVPKKYVERVGDDGFKKAPIGAGPYKFVSFDPGVELVMEAHEGYWRKTPTVKRLVWKVIPEETTRLAALKRGECDIAYSIRGELAEELKRTPGLTLKPVVINSPFWIYFAEQWDPKSPFHDPRVRRAVSLALDYDGINQALTLGHSLITYSIVPKDYEYYWQPPKIPFDPKAAAALLAEAGFKGGFDAGDYFCDSSYANLGEAVINSLRDVGIKLKMRPIERAAFNQGYAEKKYRNLIQGGSGAFGNAATRMESFVVKGGTYVYGNYPELDELFAQQADETDRAKRGVILTKMQQIVHEQTIYAPLWQLGFINGQGHRIDESAIGLMPGHPYSAPYEEVRLKSGA